MLDNNPSALDLSLNNIPLSDRSCNCSRMVLAGLGAIAIKKNDPRAVLMVCHPGSVDANIYTFSIYKKQLSGIQPLRSIFLN